MRRRSRRGTAVADAPGAPDGAPPVTRLPSDYALPEYYDLRTGHLDDDVEFLAELLSGPKTRVLELGCGTGRVLSGLARRGFRHLAGIDRSATMLAAARAKLSPHAVRLYERAVDRPFGMRFQAALGHFDAVVLAFNVIHEIGPIARRRACLENCARLLARDGCVVVDSRVPPHFRAGVRTVRDRLTHTFVDHSGNFVESFVDLTADFVQQTLVGVSRYRVFARDGVRRELEAPIRSWVVKADELHLLGEACGLRVRHAWGDYRRSTYRARSERLVTVFESALT